MHTATNHNVVAPKVTSIRAAPIVTASDNRRIHRLYSYIQVHIVLPIHASILYISTCVLVIREYLYFIRLHNTSKLHRSQNFCATGLRLSQTRFTTWVTAQNQKSLALSASKQTKSLALLDFTHFSVCSSVVV